MTLSGQVFHIRLVLSMVNDSLHRKSQQKYGEFRLTIPETQQCVTWRDQTEYTTPARRDFQTE